jgi:hypothetical protein
MAQTFVFYKGNSQFLKVSGVKDQSVTPNTYLNAGAATGTMYDPAGAVVAGCQNVTGVYQALSNGEWRFPVDPALFDPPAGGGYVLKVDITSSTIKYHCEYPVKISVRKAGTEL